MKTKTRAWLLAAACTLAGTAARPAARPAARAAPPTVAAPSVRAGIEAWAAQNWPLAIANFRPLADRGDADAQYAMAQAYFLGRGVPQNSNLAEQWYERAARQGNEEAQANYGLLLFQNGRRREAMPWIEQRRRSRRSARAICARHRPVQRRSGRPGPAARLCADEPRRRRPACRPRSASSRRWSRMISAEDRAARRRAGPRPAERAARRCRWPRRRRRRRVAARAARPRRRRQPARRGRRRCAAAARPPDARRPGQPRPGRRAGRRRRPLADPARRVRQRGQCPPRLERRAPAGCPACSLIMSAPAASSASRPGRCADRAAAAAGLRRAPAAAASRSRLNLIFAAPA